MRIAFTSCCDHAKDPTQPAWNALAEKHPDVVVLLGDTIYMDYGNGPHPGNGEAIQLPLEEFVAQMYAQYAAQAQVASFRSAIAGRRAYAIWDDHDFGCNNGRGADPEPGPPDPDFVPTQYRVRSRILFGQFARWLASPTAAYPANTLAGQQNPADLGGIEQTVNVSDGVRLHLLDGRTFRERPGRDKSILGEAQRRSLEQALLEPPGINILASGTTLKGWKDYSEFAWLKNVATRHHLIVLSGDIHEWDFRSYGRVFEVTASAMALPPGATALPPLRKRTEVFGLLDINAADITITLFHENIEKERHVIDRASWIIR